MKYKTTIELITEADNSREATDICGEYLRGSLEDGSLFMRIKTIKLKHARFRQLSLLILFTFCFSLAGFFTGKKDAYHRLGLSNSYVSNNFAMHPPLSTDAHSADNENFKKQWLKEYNKRLQDQ